MQLQRGGWWSQPWQRGSILSSLGRGPAEIPFPRVQPQAWTSCSFSASIFSAGRPSGAVRESRRNLVLPPHWCPGKGTPADRIHLRRSSSCQNQHLKAGTDPPRREASHGSLRSTSGRAGPRRALLRGPVPRSSAAFCLHKLCSLHPDTHASPMAPLRHGRPATSHHFQSGTVIFRQEQSCSLLNPEGND